MAMICEIIPVDMWNKIILRDGEKETGGIAFVGETLADFIGSDYSPYDSYEKLRAAMDACNVTMEFPYISNHGLNPKVFPNDVTIIRGEKLSRLRSLVVLDRPLSMEELIRYDISSVA
jgi:hypothetical protein